MITATIETAIKLKAAGWTKPTELVYTNYYHGEPTEKMHIEFPVHTTDPNKLSAPTTDEILADLPDELAEDIDVMILKYDGFFAVGYYNHNADFEDHLGNEIDEDDFRRWEIRFTNNSLCEALAELWLWAKKPKRQRRRDNG